MSITLRAVIYVAVGCISLYDLFAFQMATSERGRLLRKVDLVLLPIGCWFVQPISARHFHLCFCSKIFPQKNNVAFSHDLASCQHQHDAVTTLLHGHNAAVTLQYSVTAMSHLCCKNIYNYSFVMLLRPSFTFHARIR